MRFAVDRRTLFARPRFGLPCSKGHSASWDVLMWPRGRARPLCAGTLTKTLTGHTDWVLTVALAPDGYMLASASADATIGIWNVREGAA